MSHLRYIDKLSYMNDKITSTKVMLKKLYKITKKSKVSNHIL